MLRRLLNIATVASVLLAVAVGASWVRSYGNNRQGDRFAFRLGARPWELRSQGGGIALAEIDAWSFSGVSTGGTTVDMYNRRDLFNIAWWIPLAATTVAPAIRVIQWRRLRRRVIDGLCLRCGYDLRASRGRCPECGDVASG